MEFLQPSPQNLDDLFKTQYNERFFYAENQNIKKKYNSQKLKQSYRINGAIYIVSIKNLKKKNIFFHKSIGVFEMDRKHSIDIDTIFDFKIAELIKRNKF